MSTAGSRRSARPLLAAAATALVSAVLLALAVRHGWLGPDVGRGDEFCEAARDGRVRQPANAASNAGFVLAGLLIAARAGHPDRLGDVLPRHRGLATAMACLVVLLGPASAAMHATQSAAGGWLDLTSMYLVASFAASYALLRWRQWPTTAFWATFASLVAACELIGLLGDGVPVVRHPGNVAFALLLVLAVVLEVRLWSRGPARTRLRLGALALATMLVAFGIWNLGQHGWCDPGSWVQGHAVWHLLGAVAAYLLFRLYASERVTPPRR
ncbi:ceramidase domain-containing protein [Nocardioides houyundeii]|uniref:ceramidase domain-containing protein n=1 Tax=Nocardioides houyundeii TaxID=2045452 RepID=UPI000C767C3C|nr:ceramidase domain-containing protein [Nocardioides houyundeii]